MPEQVYLDVIRGLKDFVYLTVDGDKGHHSITNKKNAEHLIFTMIKVRHSVEASNQHSLFYYQISNMKKDVVNVVHFVY